MGRDPLVPFAGKHSAESAGVTQAPNTTLTVRRNFRRAVLAASRYGGRCKTGPRQAYLDFCFKAPSVTRVHCTSCCGDPLVNYNLYETMGQLIHGGREGYRLHEGLAPCSIPMGRSRRSLGPHRGQISTRRLIRTLDHQESSCNLSGRCAHFRINPVSASYRITA